MVLTRAALSEYDERIRSLGDAAYGAVKKRIASFMARFPGATVAETRDFAVESVNAAVMTYGDAASTCAADLYDQMAESAGATLPPAVLDTSDAAEYIEKEIRYQAGKLVAGKPAEFAEAAARSAKAQTQRRANDTMTKNVKRDGVGYARVPLGFETCTFCLMLASQGFVYKSAKTAGAHYHDNCRCKVVPSFGRGGKATGVEGYDPDELYRLWQKCEEIDAENSISHKTRQAAKRALESNPALSAHDAIETARTNLRKPILGTLADPAADVYGAAEDENPSKLAEIKTWLEKNGVAVRMSDPGNERIGFDPGLKRGDDGCLLATPGMSLSAWMHEADHAKYDIENGRPGILSYMVDTDLRIKMERRAYGLEIEKAERDGYNELADKLRKPLDEEIGLLRGEDGD